LKCAGCVGIARERVMREVIHEFDVQGSGDADGWCRHGRV
jgi:hypothetical protein